MDARKVKRRACGIVAVLIASYMEGGQPWDDADANGWPEGEADRLAAALTAIEREMTRRGPTKADLASAA